MFLHSVDSPIQAYVFAQVCTLNLSGGFAYVATL